MPTFEARALLIGRNSVEVMMGLGRIDIDQLLGNFYTQTELEEGTLVGYASGFVGY